MPHIHAGILSETQALAGVIIFLGSYVVFTLGKFPSLTIGRPAA